MTRDFLSPWSYSSLIIIAFSALMHENQVRVFFILVMPRTATGNSHGLFEVEELQRMKGHKVHIAYTSTVKPRHCSRTHTNDETTPGEGIPVYSHTRHQKATRWATQFEDTSDDLPESRR